MKPSPSPSAAFRPHFIGAGTAMTLVIIVLLVLTQVYKRQRATPPPRPKAAGEFRLPREPQLDIMMAKSDGLGLTRSQRAGIEKLRAQWRAESQPVIREMEMLDKELTGYLDQAQKKGNLNVKEYQKRAARMSSATREYLNLNDEYRGKAEKLLTQSQQKKLKEISKQGGEQP